MEEAILTASDKSFQDNFGFSVSMSSDGSRVVVGAFQNNTTELKRTGKVFIYLRTGTAWSQEAALFASDKDYNDGFGIAVSMTADGTRVIVGANQADPSGIPDAGKAYVFLRTGTTWAEEAILVASDKLSNDMFGQSVAISGDGTRCVVGARNADPSGLIDAGKVYVFLRTGSAWAEEQILTASDKAIGDNFGISIAVDNTALRVVIGAYQASPSSIGNSGSVYVFLRTGTTWAEEAILTASDKAAGDHFGNSVAISSDGAKVVVGAYAANPTSLSDTGKAYIFSRTVATWSQDAILTSSDKLAGDQFGFSVAMNGAGDKVVVTSITADPVVVDVTTVNAGKAYVFTGVDLVWTEDDIITSSDMETQDLFGYSSAISSDGTRYIVGAHQASPESLIGAGKAYVFA